MNKDKYTNKPVKYRDLSMLWVIIPFCCLLLFMGVGGVLLDIVIIVAFLRYQEQKQQEFTAGMRELESYRINNEDAIKKQIEDICKRMDEDAAKNKAAQDK